MLSDIRSSQGAHSLPTVGEVELQEVNLQDSKAGSLMKVRESEHDIPILHFTNVIFYQISKKILAMTPCTVTKLGLIVHNQILMQRIRTSLSA